MNRSLKLAGAAAALALCGVGALAQPASAHDSTRSTSISGGKLSAYVYIDNWSGLDNCGNFTTRAYASKTLSSITENADWDPIGIGASASIKGVGVSVSGNGGGSPSASITNRNASSATIKGVVCASWSTVYLGVYSTAVTKLNGTLYTVSAHV